ncbi:hypothetical protein F5I97DRAFT_977242 [Phlebopus sp. FC_14]|nr:hypothetical protein F5I97DRAFT_977242 [Phlebopus sp. FC_14]
MSRPPVPLPSIRDIFPEISAQPNPHTKAFGLHPTTQDRAPPSPPRTRTAKRCDESPTTCFHVSQAPPSPPPSSSSSESAPIRPVSFHQQQHLSSGAQPPKPPPSYSFNVLRTDPVTASLEHVASSTTLRHRGLGSPQAGIVNGSAPVFRVAIAPPEQQLRSVHHHHHPHHHNNNNTNKRSAQDMSSISDPRERRSNRDFPGPTTGHESDSSHRFLPHPHTSAVTCNSNSNSTSNNSSSSSAMLSFSVTDPPNSASTVISGTDGQRYLRSSEIVNPSLQGEGRGKKHQCPHCGKRFNRPSSMKIHVNTHTGAKPYRCPFPGCGREFNVNSNMRRHWRNHSRSGPLPPMSARLTAKIRRMETTTTTTMTRKRTRWTWKMTKMMTTTRVKRLIPTIPTPATTLTPHTTTARDALTPSQHQLLSTLALLLLLLRGQDDGLDHHHHQHHYHHHQQHQHQHRYRHRYQHRYRRHRRRRRRGHLWSVVRCLIRARALRRRVEDPCRRWPHPQRHHPRQPQPQPPHPHQ